MINMEARTTVLHYPRLDTVLMVEDAIKKARNYPKRTELWKKLPKKNDVPNLQNGAWLFD